MVGMVTGGGSTLPCEPPNQTGTRNSLRVARGCRAGSPARRVLQLLAVVAEPTMRASEALIGLFKVAAEIEGTGAIAEALSGERAGAAGTTASTTWQLRVFHVSLRDSPPEVGISFSGRAAKRALQHFFAAVARLLSRCIGRSLVIHVRSPRWRFQIAHIIFCVGILVSSLSS
jgi:hypothetical protein